jgi:hypothetical protein
MPAASGLSNFARITAGSFAASLTTTLWDNYETHALNNIAGAMAGGSGGGNSGGAGGVDQVIHQMMQMEIQIMLRQMDIPTDMMPTLVMLELVDQNTTWYLKCRITMIIP